MFDSRNRFGWCLKYSFTGIPDTNKYICVLILLDFRYATSAKKSKKMIQMEMRIEMHLIKFSFKTFSMD